MKKLLFSVVMLLVLPACPMDKKPSQKPTQLTDAQKYQAMQLEIEILQVQTSAQELQKRITAFSDQACGKDAALIYQNEGKEIVPSCHPNTPPAPPANAPVPPKKP